MRAIGNGNFAVAVDITVNGGILGLPSAELFELSLGCVGNEALLTSERASN